MDVNLLLSTALWTATPIAYAASGEAIAERSGMLNIGLEAMMLFGSFVSVLVTSVAGDPWIGLIAGGVAGALLGIFQSLVVLWWRLDQVVAGISLNLIALGATGVLNRLVFSGTQSQRVKPLRNVAVPILSDIPLIGDVIFEQRIATYLVPIVGFCLFFLLTRTRTGLEIRAAGEDPVAATFEGVDVRKIRVMSNTIAGFLGGIGGAFLAIGIVSTFGENMVAGRGFIALAIVVISRWNPLLVVFVAWFFGLAEAVGLVLQTSGTTIPFQFFLAVPYVATILILFTRLGSKAAPRELARAWNVEMV